MSHLFQAQKSDGGGRHRPRCHPVYVAKSMRLVLVRSCALLRGG